MCLLCYLEMIKEWHNPDLEETSVVRKNIQEEVSQEWRGGWEDVMGRYFRERDNLVNKIKSK